MINIRLSYRLWNKITSKVIIKGMLLVFNYISCIRINRVNEGIMKLKYVELY